MFTKLRTLYIFAVTITLSVIFSGCGDSLNFVAVDSFALGTFAQAKCKTTLSEQEILNIIKAVDEESKESMSIFSTTSLLSRINNNQTDSLDRHIAFNIELDIVREIKIYTSRKLLRLARSNLVCTRHPKVCRERKIVA